MLGPEKNLAAKKGFGTTLILLTLLVLGTSGCPIRNYHFRNITRYTTRVHVISASGIRVTDELGLLDTDELDRLTLEVEECLGRGMDRDRFEVMVPADVYISPCTGSWLFPCDIDPQLCRDKGVEPTEECPCNCRGAIQNDRIILIAPDLVTYKLELVRLITRVNNPYSVEGLRKCL